MRFPILAATVILAASLAGCAATDDPAKATPGPTTPSPSPTTSSSPPQGIAPGEFHPAAPTHAQNRSHGVLLVGDGDRSGITANQSVHYTFVATNEGADAKVEGPICSGTPWAFRLLRAGKEVPMHPPMVRCLAYGESEWKAGAKLDATTTWNGTVVADERTYTPAEAGDYVLEATFNVIRGEERLPVTVRLPITVA